MTSSPSTSPLRLGLAGLGTVGAGVIRLLNTNADLVTARAGRPLKVTAVSARDRTRDRGVDLSGMRWYDNATDLVADPDVDVVVELIGGSEGTARAVVEAALAAGKPVVTANKALLAIHGPALARLSAEKSAPLLFEAAVAGGIPAIKMVREGLAADRLLRIGGILNGTCNYILTVMRETGKDFGTVLADAQQLGYAEADPSTDIDGLDAAHKLTILAGLAFGQPVAFESLHVEGIRRIGALDLTFARTLGYRIKLLGMARMGDDGLEARVTPCLVPENAPIAQVDGVFNAVVAEGAFAGRLMIEGRGAGAGPTASAVAADLIDIARGHTIPVWGVQATDTPPLQANPVSAGTGAFYLRLLVEDRPGVIADITAVLRDCGVSLRSMLQHTPEQNDADPYVPLVLVTHQTSEAAMQDAVARIDGLDVVTDTPVMIRIETD
ncbi:homoserine dehydrogenase [Acetobacter cerevisiae]|uniref:Homoserine dehydrogenase n=1 Tax=Acetobacter cerevisiae TaxID=178900 RepID=A0A149UW32_9PROT|nr:homoserine dehydrogenase [Acetobacter cerevisiae]KXV72160.1 homoserine dehydrogenase [Acetobacter cerevisiae]MCP1246513.1 homoserine dehydrogenase [Acetobacter cerevisiae]MCP1256052.1 homoserine dehydrogenase [Acetobacter cerevisiae]MCP1269658.1 homoserine dehydrogenase [Acetobacter cerevisiae]MCP1277612.1 homoserine dehydrogenase [Acetobacter cerevisiae]